MLGVIVNASTVIIGSLIGIIAGSRFPETVKNLVLDVAGIVTLLIGFQMGAQSENIILPLLAVIIGGMIGHALHLEDGILALGRNLHKIYSKGDGQRFASGFLDASVLFCAGAMTIVGSFQSGTLGDHQLIFLKSTLDGFMAVILASTMGLGVMFSALVILVYQGALVLSSVWLAPLIQSRMINEVGAAGGIMVTMIGLNLLRLKSIPTANFVPALVLAPLLVKLQEVLQAALNLP